MKLHFAEKTINYPMLRLASENNLWEMGIYPTIYGTRVSCNRIGSQVYLKAGYCCGTIGSLIMEVTLAIAVILISFSEEATNGDLEFALSDWKLRPINQDDGLEKLRRAVQSRLDLELPVYPIEDSQKVFSQTLQDIVNNVDIHRLAALNFVQEQLHE
jgi:hypothetical protein